MCENWGRRFDYSQYWQIVYFVACSNDGCFSAAQMWHAFFPANCEPEK